VILLEKRRELDFVKKNLEGRKENRDCAAVAEIIDFY
jgi:hypothetical protein